MALSAAGLERAVSPADGIRPGSLGANPETERGVAGAVRGPFDGNTGSACSILVLVIEFTVWLRYNESKSIPYLRMSGLPAILRTANFMA